MENRIKKFLQFNGKTLSFLAVDGIYYIAIKPICEALNIQFDYYYRRLKSDKILGQLLCIHTMVGGDNRLRKMVALPEKYIYGWLFSINSENQLLHAYKIKCYDLLYDHFQGTIKQRHQLYEEKIAIESEMHELDKILRNVQDYDRLNHLKGKFLANGRALKALERQEIQTELSLFN